MLVLIQNSETCVNHRCFDLFDVLEIASLKVYAYPAACHASVGICALVVNADDVAAKVGYDL